MSAGALRRILIAATVVLLVLGSLPGSASAAEEPLRTWRDSSGNFSIQARLLQRSATDVQLGTADGRSVNVPIARLSAADQEYLTGLSRAASGGDSPAGPSPARPAAPAPPPGPVAPPAAPELVARDKAAPTAASGAVLPGEGAAAPPDASEPPRGLAADPGAQQPLSAGGFEVSPVDAYDHISPPMLVDPASQLVAVSIGRHQINDPQNARGRIYIGRLPKGPAQLAMELPQAIELLDVDPASGRAVFAAGHDGLWRGGDLVLLEGLATGKPQEVFRRQLPGMEKPGFKPQATWARLLSGEHVAVVVDYKLYVWNLRSAQLLYSIDQIDSSTPPAVSPNRRYLAVPRGGGASLLDIVDGRSLGLIRFGGSLKPGVVFDPAGSQLALAVGNQLMIWDFVRGEALCEATLAGHLGGKLLGWVAPEALLTASGTLIRTDLEMAIWGYSVSGGELTAAAQGMLVALKRPSCAVGYLPVPHPAAVTAGKQAERGGEAMMLVRPGSKVAVDAEVPAGVEREAVIAALRQGLESTGWEIVPRADITVVAQVGQAAEQTLSYNQMAPGQPRGSGTVTTATIKPFTAELQIRRGGEVLWTRKTQNYVPSMLFLRNGQTLQEAVKQFERPNTEFFAGLTIPPRIPKPELANGLGRSTMEAFEWRDAKAAPASPRSPIRRPGR